MTWPATSPGASTSATGAWWPIRRRRPRHRMTAAGMFPCVMAPAARSASVTAEVRAVLEPARLRPADVARDASVGVRTRRMRAALSALGIAIGVAAMVAVLGLSASSQAGLLAEIDKLGTNLLTVTNGTGVLGNNEELPLAAP